MKNQFDRRDFLKKGAKASLGIALGSMVIPLEAEEIASQTCILPLPTSKIGKSQNWNGWRRWHGNIPCQ